MLHPKPLLWTGSVLLASLGGPAITAHAQGVPPAPADNTPVLLSEPVAVPEPGRVLLNAPSPTVVLQDESVPECETKPGRFQQWKQQHRAKWADKMWGYPSEFQRPPVGGTVQHYREQQKLNGRLARMALSEYDFLPGAAELKPRGREHLARISEWLPQVPGEIAIEPTREGLELDEARRQSVYQELATLPCGIALVNIRTARRRHPGLDAPSARLIYSNRLQQTRLRGTTYSGGTMGSEASTDASAGAGTDPGGANP
jgi:hypothetical protein